MTKPAAPTPVVVAFYDMLDDAPFTTTFYVRDTAPRDWVRACIEAI